MTSWSTVALVGVSAGIPAGASIVVAVTQKAAAREQSKTALDQANAERIDRHQSNRQNHYSDLLSSAQQYLFVLENPKVYASDVNPVRLHVLHAFAAQLAALASVSPSVEVDAAATTLGEIRGRTYRPLLIEHTEDPPDPADVQLYRKTLDELRAAIRADTKDTRP
jgi:hypothetical protein